MIVMMMMMMIMMMMMMMRRRRRRKNINDCNDEDAITIKQKKMFQDKDICYHWRKYLAALCSTHRNKEHE